jgi:hypothetical protein
VSLEWIGSEKRGRCVLAKIEQEDCEEKFHTEEKLVSVTDNEQLFLKILLYL